MLALAIGTILALGAVAFVLYPLLVPPRFGERRAEAPEEIPGSTAVEALREIEFDRQTGKLSDTDYAALKASYTERALSELRADSAPPVELPRPTRGKCPDHGRRPESDAIYCSECGRYLAGACPKCGAGVTEPAARYCAGCGNTLAA
jgi:hypothetical protein